MMIERQVKSFSPWNTAEVSQEKDDPVISQTIETNDLVWNEKNLTKHNKTIKCLHAAHLK